MTDQPMALSAMPTRPAARYEKLSKLFARITTAVRLRSWMQPVTLLGIGMIAVIYVMLGVLIVGDRREAVANAIKHGDNLVRIIDQAYGHILQGTDSTLLVLRRTYSRSPSTIDLKGLFDDPEIQAGLDNRYIMADASGRIVAATYGSADGSSLVGQEFPDLESLQRQKNARDDELLISPPHKSGAAGSLDVFLTRRLLAADGNFAGVVAAALDSSQLTRFGAELDLGARGTFGLMGFDGVVRARAENGAIDHRTIGRQFAPGTGALAYALKAPAGHFWNAPGVFDDVSRLVSFRVIDGYPMIATVTTAESEIFRHANKQATIYWVIALLGTAVALIGMRWGAARQHKLNAATSKIIATQDELRKSEERYRLVEDAVNEGIWDWDIDADVCYRSPHWKHMLGFGDDAPASMAALMNLIHPDDRAAVDAALRTHLADEAPYAIEFRLQGKNGDYRWIQSRGKAQRDETGKPTRMLGTLTDITDRKLSEASLQESHANLGRAEATALLGHFRYVKATNEYTWSEGLYRILGKSPATFTATYQASPDFIAPEDRPMLLQQREHILSGGAPHPLTLRAIRDDGRMIYIETWLEATHDSDGVVTGMFGSVHDVTARKLAELDHDQRVTLKRAADLMSAIVEESA